MNTHTQTTDSHATGRTISTKRSEARFEVELLARLSSVLAPASVRLSEIEGGRIVLLVDGPFRLTRVQIGFDAITRLADDPDRLVKLEYLERDLRRSAATRRTWSYPRVTD